MPKKKVKFNPDCRDCRKTLSGGPRPQRVNCIWCGEQLVCPGCSDPNREREPYGRDDVEDDE